MMKQFYRLPRWLRIVLPAIFVSLCVGINAVAFTEMMTLFPQINPSQIFNQTILEQAEAKLASPTKLPVLPTATASSTLPFEPVSEPVPEPVPEPDTLTIEAKYGHLPYAEGNAIAMERIASYAEGDTQRYEMLHSDAAAALLDMVAAARVDGVWLVPTSGFRTIAEQRTLFNAQMATKGSPEAAALTSAPPGYSEHHTGYAVDLTDGTLPQAEDVSPAFAESFAYEWLLANADRFDFELSFADNNSQGIAYEPWHWRYIGSAAAKALFRPQSSAQSSAPLTIQP